MAALIAASTIVVLDQPTATQAEVGSCPVRTAPYTTVASSGTHQVLVAKRVSGHAGWFRRFQFVVSTCRWEQVGYTTAVFGINGVVPARERVENSGRTPAGTFRLLSAFGQGNPGTRMPYARITGQWWDGRHHSATFNQMIPRQGGCTITWCEPLADDVPPRGYVYTQAVVISYNTTAPYVWSGGGSGSGIFLHYAHYFTEGCVGLQSLNQLTATVRWLDPGQQPRIVIQG